MSDVTRFSMTRTEKLRRALEKAAELPHDRDPYDFPDSPDGWFKSPGDPSAIVSATEVLSVRADYRLVGYLYGAGADGNGMVWAIPADASFPEPDECEHLEDHFADPPRPPHALDNFMDAIEGDGSAWSYLTASLLVRQLYEYGAMWHGIYWGTHHLICRDPWDFAPAMREGLPTTPHSPREEWTWLHHSPKDWRPTVEVNEKRVTVSFFTLSALGRETLTRHVDRYSVGSYRPETDSTELGTGTGGFVF